jgi:hypothetical protein
MQGCGPQSSSQNPLCSTSNRTPCRGWSGQSRGACFVATPPVGERRAAGHGGLKQFAEVGRELEVEPVLNGDSFGVSQAGVELKLVDDEVAGRVLAEGVLGAAEIVDEFLPADTVHLGVSVLSG